MSEEMNKSDNIDEILTMVDVLEQEEKLEKEYAATLGGSDEKCCTYSRVSKLFFLVFLYSIDYLRLKI